MENYICKIPSLEELNRKWDYEIANATDDKENWIVWKEKAIRNFQSGKSIPYYGFLDEKIICEATALVNKEAVQNSDGLVNETTAYLCAFRTIEDYQNQGYFSKLFRFMIDDLRSRGYQKVTLGVEPEEVKNREIYAHLGFDEFIKRDAEVYPDGTRIEVEYYGRHV